MLYENSSPIRKSAAYVNSILKNLIYWWRITNEPYSRSEQHKFPIFIVTNFAFPTFYMSLENWTTGKVGFDTPAQKNLWLGVEKERKVITSYVERAMRFAIQLFFLSLSMWFSVSLKMSFPRENVFVFPVLVQQQSGETSFERSAFWGKWKSSGKAEKSSSKRAWFLESLNAHDSRNRRDKRWICCTWHRDDGTKWQNNKNINQASWSSRENYF